MQRQVRDKTQVEVPNKMVENYLDNRMEEFKKQKQEVNENGREQYRPMAVNGIRWSLLTNKIMTDEKIEVLPSDTENWINGFAQSNKVTVEQAKQLIAQDNRASNLIESLLEEEVLDFLMETADKNGG